MRQPLQEITALRNKQAATIDGVQFTGEKKNAEYKGRFKVFVSCRLFLI